MNGNNAAAIPYDSTCEWCRWFREQKVRDGNGLCFVAPPLVLMDRENNRTFVDRPAVYRDDVCAQWLPGQVEL